MDSYAHREWPEVYPKSKGRIQVTAPKPDKEAGIELPRSLERRFYEREELDRLTVYELEDLRHFHLDAFTCLMEKNADFLNEAYQCYIQKGRPPSDPYLGNIPPLWASDEVLLDADDLAVSHRATMKIFRPVRFKNWREAVFCLSENNYPSQVSSVQTREQIQSNFRSTNPRLDGPARSINMKALNSIPDPDNPGLEITLKEEDETVGQTVVRLLHLCAHHLIQKRYHQDPCDEKDLPSVKAAILKYMETPIEMPQDLLNGPLSDENRRAVLEQCPQLNPIWLAALRRSIKTSARLFEKALADLEKEGVLSIVRPTFGDAFWHRHPEMDGKISAERYAMIHRLSPLEMKRKRRAVFKEPGRLEHFLDRLLVEVEKDAPAAIKSARAKAIEDAIALIRASERVVEIDDLVAVVALARRQSKEGWPSKKNFQEAINNFKGSAPDDQQGLDAPFYALRKGFTILEQWEVKGETKVIHDLWLNGKLINLDTKIPKGGRQAALDFLNTATQPDHHNMSFEYENLAKAKSLLGPILGMPGKNGLDPLIKVTPASRSKVKADKEAPEATRLPIVKFIVPIVAWDQDRVQ